MNPYIGSQKSVSRLNLGQIPGGDATTLNGRNELSRHTLAPARMSSKQDLQVSSACRISSTRDHCPDGTSAASVGNCPDSRDAHNGSVDHSRSPARALCWQRSHRAPRASRCRRRWLPHGGPFGPAGQLFRSGSRQVASPSNRPPQRCSCRLQQGPRPALPMRVPSPS